MKPLIDADILLYEVGFGCVTGWKGESPPPFDYAKEMMDERITWIANCVNATSPPILYLTGSSNFRTSIATKKGYKAQRVSPKPFHYYNLKAYLQGAYECRLQEGLEADDLLCIDRAKDLENAIICSRDKDLRQHEGWVFSWECGKQPSFGPFYVSGYGEIELYKDRKKIVGYGPKFFLSQCLTGDTVDNFGGIKGYGPVEASNTLQATLTYPEGLEAVVGAYKGFYGDVWEEELLEQAQLAYLIKELDENGEPVGWNMNEYAVDRG